MEIKPTLPSPIVKAPPPPPPAPAAAPPPAIDVGAAVSAAANAVKSAVAQAAQFSADQLAAEGDLAFKPIGEFKRAQKEKDAETFKQLDSDGDGAISESEAGIVPGENDGINWQLNQQREQKFRKADKDHDGQLSPEEYAASLKEERTLEGDLGPRTRH